MVRRTLVAQVAATLVLVAGVWMLGAKTKADIRAGESNARKELTEQLRNACSRGVARDFEAYDTNRDLAGFAEEAATARAKDGNIKAAAQYRARAASARARMVSIKTRLPASDNVADVLVFCRELYPAVPDTDFEHNPSPTPVGTRGHG